MIQVESLTKQYSGRVLFDGIDWHISREARIGLVGPNGAGKTTLMRILAGEEGCDAGGVRRPKAVRVGYLPQDVTSAGTSSILAEVLDALPDVRGIERELEELEAELSRAGGEDSSRIMARYGALRDRFEALGGYELEAAAKRILSGLGIPERRFHEPVPALSGGFRMRVALARLLLAKPDLLLLDEPTNHLDLESLVWLEEFMSSYPGTVIVASHDRFFLNRMVTEIAEIDDGRFTLTPGNYDDYIGIRRLRREQAEAKARQQSRKVAEIERFIERFRAKATKARQVQSRVKMLEKMERVEVPRESRKKVRLSFPPPPRAGATAIEVNGLVKRYGGTTVYGGVDFVARRGERIALVGPNGAGKTTLLRVLAGALPFEDGSRRLGHNVSLAHYAQHQLETLDPSRTVLEEISSAAPDELRPRVRHLLGLFLFSGDDVDKKVAVLSGGEKARLALCRMLLRPANLLLLDEPTNHLDLRSREVLEEALEEYAGTIVLISHDRYFINRIADRICEIRDGRLEMHIGNYDDYTRSLRRSDAAADAGDGDAARRPPAPSGPRAGKVAGRTARRPGAARGEKEERRRRERAAKPLRERLETIESEIASAERSRDEVLARQAEPEVYSDGDRARDAARQRRELEERLAHLYDTWDSLAREIERMTSALPDAGEGS